MQETGPEWVPMYEPHLSGEVRLFILFLLIALIFMAMQWARFVYFLGRTRKLGPEPGRDSESSAVREFLRDMELASIRVGSLRKTAVVVFLTSVLVLLDGTARILRAIAIEKNPGSAALAGAGAETLAVFSIGILVCTVLYASFAILNTRLQRKKVQWEHRPGEKFPQPTASAPETKPLPLPSN